MSDDERKFKVTATKTLTATFEVYADDEDDARFQIEFPPDPFMFGVTVSDAINIDEENWDVSTIEEQP